MFSLVYPFFLSKLSHSDIISVTGIWMCVYASFLYIQFFSFYFFGNLIDYSLLLGGEPSRILNFVGLRASGLTSEPSIYSGIMISMMVIYYIYNGKNTACTYFAGVSILFTLSTLGVFLFIVYFFSTLVRKLNLKKLILLFFIFTSSFFFILPQLVSRYERFIDGNDVSNNVKIYVIENFIHSPVLALIGYGVIGFSQGAPDYYQALYDLTLFGNLIIIFGIPLGCIFSLAVIFMIVKMKVSFQYKILIALCLIKVTIPNFIFFYLFLSLLMSRNDNRRDGND
ncbi:hypothetical protein [Edwardsiella tarda]|uniref:hypothetical protein n=1 Tax=Edwardsiella tarda TaxID=636 RepID=UPI00111294E0|nr:hypothetical protein [Edwardsiella tarda]